MHSFHILQTGEPHIRLVVFVVVLAVERSVVVNVTVEVNFVVAVVVGLKLQNSVVGVLRWMWVW